MNIHDLPTPSLLLDLVILQGNLETMAEKASSLGVSLRPHIKTHKCLEIARMQQERGARGITVSTLVEARTFADAGFDDITYAFPLDSGKISQSLDLSERVTLRLVVDDLATAAALETAAAGRDQAAAVGRDQAVPVWLKVDCGLHRAGVDPTSDYAVRLARFLHEAPHLIFDGLLTHAGQAYKVTSREEVLNIADQERDIMVAFAERLRSEGVAVPTVSVGSTPTMSVVQHLEGVQEMRPGNYVFHDRAQVALGSCDFADCAVTVLTAVVSHQPGSSHVVVDAGALAMSHDPGPVQLDSVPGKGAVVTEANPLAIHPSLLLVSLSQEHGIIQGTGPKDLAGLEVGSRVRILPNHACLTVALFDEYAVVKGEEVVDHWKIRRDRS
ncbi:MAG: alanine racemase [Fidelibacterota bacterium]|nr:MAG: alanine racemase [Candidatus Neomarinimicrobiota bacterium]